MDENSAGTAFKLVIPFGDGNSRENPPTGSAYYTYEAGTLRLLFNTDEESLNIGGPRQLTAKFRTRRRAGSEYMASNAFGATAKVIATHIYEDRLGLTQRPEGEVSPYKLDLEAKYPTPPSLAGRLPASPRDTYWIGLPLSGPNAKRTSLDTQVVVEGVLAQRWSIFPSLVATQKWDGPSPLLISLA